jgi:BMFP domain-containing protein YqiC
MAAIRRQVGRNLQDLEVVVREASGALTVSQHDHLHELLERLQRIEAAVTHGQGSGSAR